MYHNYMSSYQHSTLLMCAFSYFIQRSSSDYTLWWRVRSRIITFRSERDSVACLESITTKWVHTTISTTGHIHARLAVKYTVITLYTAWTLLKPQDVLVLICTHLRDSFVQVSTVFASTDWSLIKFLCPWLLSRNCRVGSQQVCLI